MDIGKCPAKNPVMSEKPGSQRAQLPSVKSKFFYNSPTSLTFYISLHSPKTVIKTLNNNHP